LELYCRAPHGEMTVPTTGQPLAYASHSQITTSSSAAWWIPEAGKGKAEWGGEKDTFLSSVTVKETHSLHNLCSLCLQHITTIIQRAWFAYLFIFTYFTNAFLPFHTVSWMSCWPSCLSLLQECRGQTLGSWETISQPRWVVWAFQATQLLASWYYLQLPLLLIHSFLSSTNTHLTIPPLPRCSLDFTSCSPIWTLPLNCFHTVLNLSSPHKICLFIQILMQHWTSLDWHKLILDNITHTKNKEILFIKVKKMELFFAFSIYVYIIMIFWN
jgi:hypothetical protein